MKADVGTATLTTVSISNICKSLHSYLLTYLLIYGAEPFLRSCAATQELPSILMNPKVHHRVHKSPPLVPIRGFLRIFVTSLFFTVRSC
jgi:hypothetical protein